MGISDLVRFTPTWSNLVIRVTDGEEGGRKSQDLILAIS